MITSVGPGAVFQWPSRAEFSKLWKTTDLESLPKVFLCDSSEISQLSINYSRNSSVIKFALGTTSMKLIWVTTSWLESRKVWTGVLAE